MNKKNFLLLVAIATIVPSYTFASSDNLLPLPAIQQVGLKPSCEYWFFYSSGSTEDKVAINNFLTFYKKKVKEVNEYRKVFIQVRKTSYFRSLEDLFGITHSDELCATQQDREFSWYIYYSLLFQIF